MDVVVLDKDFRQMYRIDNYISLIWTERYYEAGDFELYMSPQDDFLDFVLQNGLRGEVLYFKIAASDRVMMFETMEVTTNPEEGGRLKITGSSLEKILDRRIYWEGYNMAEAKELSTFLYDCLYNNVTNPKDSNRKISNFIFSKNEWTILNKNIKTLPKEYLSETIYEMISEQCRYNNYGFKVLLSTDNHFDFVLYKGVDRSPMGAVTNPIRVDNLVTVSPMYDNLSESKYLGSNSDFKNVTLIEAQGKPKEEGDPDRIFKTKSKAEKLSGLNRREIYTDARNISWKKSDYTSDESVDKDELITDEEFDKLVMASGEETLENHHLTVAFEGMIEPNVSFIYGVDYSLGDVIYIVDEYGTEGSARITEVIRSYDDSGKDMSFTLEEQGMFN